MGKELLAFIKELYSTAFHVRSATLTNKKE